MDLLGCCLIFQLLVELKNDFGVLSIREMIKLFFFL